ncbi:MAG: hypothetical protein ACI8VW_003091 [bacterium]|jgi:hypothetical protein
MRRLGISLLVVVIISIIGAGWIIDGLFSRLKAPDNTFAVARVLGNQLTNQIDRSGQGITSFADIAETTVSI